MRGGREGDRKKRERYREETCVYEKGARESKNRMEEGGCENVFQRLSHVSIDRLRNQN